METMSQSGCLEQSDKTRLIEMFPPEIWFLILNKIKDPLLLQNLCNASCVFQEFLHRRKTEFLFPIVFKNLEHRLLNFDVIVQYDQQPCKDCGRTRRIVSRHTPVLSLRSICRSWNFGVELHADWLARENNDYFFKTNLDQPGKSSDFLRHFASTHCSDQGTAVKNPLLGRSISLGLRLFALRDQDAKTSVLSRFGHFIQDVTMLFYGDYDKTNMYARLHLYLVSMPNLTSLKIFGDRLGIFINDIETEVMQEPLPMMVHLESLQIEAVQDKIILEVVNKSPNLKNILVRRSDIFKLSYCMAGVLNDVLSLPKLTNVEVQSVTKQELVVLESVCQRGGLVGLSRYGVGFDAIYKYSINKQFKHVEYWKNTLTELNLTLGKFPISTLNSLKSLERRKLDLPNLKTLSLKVTFITSFDFLLGLKKLEYLKLSLEWKFSNDKMMERALQIVETQQAELVGYQHRLGESNVWQMFTLLKHIKYYWNFHISPNKCHGVYSWPEWIIGPPQYHYSRVNIWESGQEEYSRDL